MIFDEIKILRQHGKQFIPDVTKPQLPRPYKGRPEISDEKVNEQALAALCPTGAIGISQSVPRWVRICTTWFEKPQRGISGVPFR